MKILAEATTIERPRIENRALSWMQQIDGLRALAVGLVICAHYPPFNWMFVQVGLSTGVAGVRLFFVISGFLITGILLNCRATCREDFASRLFAMRQFYARRFLRIFPLYYFVLALVLVFVTGPTKRLLWYALYLYDWFVSLGGEAIHSLGHFWSLAVEEQFYLVWPCLVLFTPSRYLPKICVSMLFISLFWRAADIEHVIPLGGHLTMESLDSLGVGALLALWHFRGVVTSRQETFLRFALWFGGCGTLFFILADGLKFRHISGVPAVIFNGTVMNLLFVWMVHKAAGGFGGTAGRLLSARPVLYLGRISYGIYVYHPFVPHCLKYLLPKAGIPYPKAEIVQFLLCAPVAVGVAALSWRFFESPINALKRYFPYQNQRTEFSSPAVPASLARAL